MVTGRNGEHRRRPRAAITLLLSVTLLLGSLGTAPAHAKTLRQRLLEMINQTRDRYDRRPLKLSVTVSRDALRHTRRMVRKDRIFHSPDLPESLDPYDWSSWGENVGCASTLRTLHRSLMKSAVHRSNILKRGFRRIGLGVVRSDGYSKICGDASQFWATEIFWG